MAKLLTAVIVHYRNESLLLDQLSQVDFDDIEVIVVDNSSLLDKSDLPAPVTLIQNPQNFGFSRACNQGLLRSSAEWVAFLNPDVLISKENLLNWLEYAKAHHLDACSPLPTSKNYQKPLPSFYSFVQEFTPLGKILPVIRKTITLTGGALLIKKSVLSTIGGWDERFFLWFEDSDLTKSLVDSKYRIGFYPGDVQHLGGQSFSTLTDEVKKSIFFNSLENYSDKHFSWLAKIIGRVIKNRFTKKKTLTSLNPGLVSLVVPNLKIELLDSFLQVNFKYFDFDKTELIIVSSALSDQNVLKYRKKYPQVRFIPITNNTGFAKTVNIGIKVASGDYVGTINDDVILTKDWLKPLLAQLDKHPGSANPIIKDKFGGIESAGIDILPIGKATPVQVVKKNSPYLTDITNGAAVVYSKKVLQKVGLFDENFGSYLEDVDLSLRITKAGFNNWVVPTSVITHLKHQTSGSPNFNKAWFDLKNWWLVIVKNWPWSWWAKYFPRIILERGRNISGLVKANPKAALKTIFVLILIGLFVFLRLYKIETSLLFFNDIGRDFLELLNWQTTGKPPLLGPQTSALPYNQSAFYFYLLFPVFFLTNHSPYATILTGVIFYLLLFVFGLIWLRNEKYLQRSLILSFLLMTIHPQFIVQNRFIWNPSFIGPLLLLAFFSYIKLLKKYTLFDLVLFSLTITFAVSLNYSVAPLFLAFMLLVIPYFKQNFGFLKIWLSSTMALIFWNAPTIVFELRHDFLLTNLLIHGEKLKQTAVTFGQKFYDTLHFGFYNLEFKQSLLFLVILLILVVLNFWPQMKQKSKIVLSPIFQSLILLAITLIITFIVPISMQAHYIFAILTMLLIAISLLGNWSFTVAAILFAVIYLSPAQLNSYFSPAYRSVVETQQCAALLCKNELGPMFVSVQAGVHPYHNGMEFKYLFKNAGCQIKELDTQINEALKMAVVVDRSQYEHGKTSYNELTQFGPSHELRRHQCNPDLEVVILEKLTN